jgi:hypothetical protein
MRPDPEYVNIAYAEMNRCTAIIAKHGIKIPMPLRIIVNRKPQKSVAIFIAHNQIAVNFAQIKSAQELIDAMQASMASLTMAAEYAAQHEVFRNAVSIHRTVRPELNLIGSPRWLEALSWFKG